MADRCQEAAAAQFLAVSLLCRVRQQEVLAFYSPHAHSAQTSIAKIGSYKSSELQLPPAGHTHTHTQIMRKLGFIMY